MYIFFTYIGNIDSFWCGFISRKKSISGLHIAEETPVMMSTEPWHCNDMDRCIQFFSLCAHRHRERVSISFSPSASPPELVVINRLTSSSFAAWRRWKASPVISQLCDGQFHVAVKADNVSDRKVKPKKKRIGKKRIKQGVKEVTLLMQCVNFPWIQYIPWFIKFAHRDAFTISSESRVGEISFQLQICTCASKNLIRLAFRSWLGAARLNECPGIFPPQVCLRSACLRRTSLWTPGRWWRAAWHRTSSPSASPITQVLSAAWTISLSPTATSAQGTGWWWSELGDPSHPKTPRWASTRRYTSRYEACVCLFFYSMWLISYTLFIPIVIVLINFQIGFICRCWMMFCKSTFDRSSRSITSHRVIVSTVATCHLEKKKMVWSV